MKTNKTIRVSEKWICAKDLFSHLGLKWNGNRSISFLPNSMVRPQQIVTKVSTFTCRVNHTMISSKGLERILSHYNVRKTTAGHVRNIITKALASSEVRRQMKTVHNEVNDLKALTVQETIMPLLNPSANDLRFKTRHSKFDITKENEATFHIRQLVSNFAQRIAARYQVTDKKKMSVFYNLTFRALYAKFQEATRGKVDLLKMAEIAADRSLTHKHASVLQLAAKTGFTTDLLQLASVAFAEPTPTK